MSAHEKPKKSAKQPRAFGWMAEYADDHQLLDAAAKVRDSGYTRTDAFTPFAVHGIDEALGMKPTILPWLSLIAGVTGLSVALTMQYWMNAVDYPYIISGKPYASWPAFIPVTFELTVLFSAFTTVFGMLALNGLPRFNNPVFTNPKFDRSTDDRFFLWIDSRDKYFNSDKVQSLLTSTGALSVEEVREDESPSEVPKVILFTIVALILVTLIPGAIVLNMRNAKSGESRFHVFFDMDFQPSKHTQSRTTNFADGRVQRPPVEGTIARGDLGLSDPYVLGYDPEQTAALFDSASSAKLVSFPQEGEPADVVDADAAAADEPTTDNAPEQGATSAPAAQEPPTSEQPAVADVDVDADIDAAADVDAGADEPATDKAADENSSSTPPVDAAPTTAQPSAASEASADASKQAADTAPAEATAAADAPAAAAGGTPDYAWLTELPVKADEALFELGRRKFEQNCAVCHGYGGYGDGLVAQRAAQLNQSSWFPPTSLHGADIQKQPVGRIYYTITHGKGKMGSYAASLSPQERWAVVAYVRALQRSQNSQASDIPDGASVSQ